MIGTLLFVVFVGLMAAGVPIAVALGIGGIVAIAAANADAPWWGLFAAPQNMHASIAKYPLLAFLFFYLTCIAVTWWHYSRRNAPMPC